jgi:hypothetical protein
MEIYHFTWGDRSIVSALHPKKCLEAEVDLLLNNVGVDLASQVQL